MERHASTVSKIFGGAVGAVVASATGISVAGAFVSPLITDQIDRASKEMINRHLAPNQDRRLGLAMWQAKLHLEAAMKNGAALRQDQFITGAGDAPAAASEIIEGAFRASMDSFEEAKARHLGVLAANICLERFSHIDQSTAAVAITIADRLSYRGYILLRMLKNIDRLGLAERREGVGLPVTPNVSALLVELYSLYQLSLAGMVGDGNSWLAVLEAGSISPAHMRLGPLGETLYDLLGLAAIDEASMSYQVALQAMTAASQTVASLVAIDRGTFPVTTFDQE